MRPKVAESHREQTGSVTPGWMTAQKEMKMMAETPTIAASYTFDPFSRHQFYHDVNESLVRKALERLDTDRPKGERVRVVELASGTGAVTELILDTLQQLERPASVIGVEPSFEAIAVAREHLQGRDVQFEQGDVDRLAEITSDANAIFFCNAIHLIPNKAETLAKIAGALAQGGYFAANSTFFDGAYTPGSERFYPLWIRRALGWLRQHHPDIRPSRTEKAMARQFITAEQYAELLDSNGLRVVSSTKEQAALPTQAYRDISNYWLFIEGALPGVPIPLGAEALEHGVVEAMKELQLTEVPRFWLQLIAQRI